MNVSLSTTRSTRIKLTKPHVQMRIYGYNENGEVADIKVLTISKEGHITLEEGLGPPAKENISKEKPHY